MAGAPKRAPAPCMRRSTTAASGEAPTGERTRLTQRDILRADAPAITGGDQAGTAQPAQLAIAPALWTDTGITTAAQRAGRHAPVMILAAVEAAMQIGIGEFCEG